jgi:hypothetical protein
VLETDGHPGSDRKRTLARLAALQRLREHIRGNERSAMLESIEHLIDVEARSLQKAGDHDEHPQD